jgi:Phosphotransferase enzyme family
MAMAPISTPEVLWRKPPALALAALPGTALGHLGEPSTASPAAWAAAGAAVRTLHDAPLPPWRGRSIDELASRLDGECEWLVANDVLPADLVTRTRRLAETALRPWIPVFIHGDLQVDHVFVDRSDHLHDSLDPSARARSTRLVDRDRAGRRRARWRLHRRAYPVQTPRSADPPGDGCPGHGDRLPLCLAGRLRHERACQRHRPQCIRVPACRRSGSRRPPGFSGSALTLSAPLGRRGAHRHDHR